MSSCTGNFNISHDAPRLDIWYCTVFCKCQRPQPASRVTIRCSDASNKKPTSTNTLRYSSSRSYLCACLRKCWSRGFGSNQPTDGSVGAKQHRPLRRHVHPTQAYQHLKYLAGQSGRSSTSFDGVGSLHGLTQSHHRYAGMDTGSTTLCLAVSSLQLPVPQSEQGIRTRGLQDDVGHES